MANIIKTAEKYIGYNSHHFIDNFKRVGGRGWSWVNYDTAWCCIFVWDIFYECSASKLFYDGGLTASCPAAMAWCKGNTTRVSIPNCKAGDIIFFDWTGSGSPDHIGFVEKKLSNTTVQTIEGNTNNSVVARRTRSAEHILAIYRPAYTSGKSVTTINRKYKVVNPKGAPMRRGASKRYLKVATIPYGTVINGRKMTGDGYIWTTYGKTGWTPIKEGKNIYLHIV